MDGVSLLPDARWYASSPTDPRALALYLRHYSAWKRRAVPLSRRFVGPGEQLVLLTVPCDALFVWRRERPEYRMDGQRGVNCAVFRNESPYLSSTLILEAEQLAWARWVGERLFTFVDAGKVRPKRDPGRCFLRAGWRRCGQSARGLLLFEKYPEPGAREDAA